MRHSHVKVALCWWEHSDTEGSYEHADDDFLERQPSPDRATRDGSISRSIEPSFLLDNNDMEEEIGELQCRFL